MPRHARFDNLIAAMQFFKLGLAAAAAALALTAQDAIFVETMKSIAAASGALRKMEKPTGPQAVSQAEKAAAGYEVMIGFWRQRNSAVAVKASEAGKSAAVRLAAAAHAGDAEKAAAALQDIGGTCQGCHDKHRVKLPDGRFRVK
jgi:cytochrome c556